MDFEINGVEHWIERLDDGYVWASDVNESDDIMQTVCAAQQDALDKAQAKIADAAVDAAQREENKLYGTYEEQVEQYWKSQRGC